jgi:hypothetical protein
MRPTLALTILLGGVIAAPLAAAAVLVEWSRTGGALGVSPAMWSARVFMAYYDASVTLLLLRASRLACGFDRMSARTPIEHRRLYA